MTARMEAATAPVVFAADGRVRATSRDVAAFFEKRHDNVVRDIERLIEQEPSLRGHLLNFEEMVVDVEIGSGAWRKAKAYSMDRDGFTLLAMGFTGSAALRWKVRYIEAFNAMEARLRAPQPAAVDYSDPKLMLGVLQHLQSQIDAKDGEIAEMRPQVQALERIAVSDGSMCVTDAAKTLQVRPKTLFTHLRAHRWIYSRAGMPGEIAYQDKLASGLLEHKTTTIHRTDGSEKTVTQVRVTSKGLTRLARELSPAQRQFGLGDISHGAPQ